MVSASRHNCLKHRPAVPFGWCLKIEVGAVLVKMTCQMRLLSGLGGVLGGVKAERRKLWKRNTSVCGWMKNC